MLILSEKEAVKNIQALLFKRYGSPEKEIWFSRERDTLLLINRQ
jgi:hypothetical protein